MQWLFRMLGFPSSSKDAAVFWQERGAQSLEAGTSRGPRAPSAPAALSISGIPARWTVCAVIRHPDSGIYPR